jgi:hypothetical protein
MTLPLNRLPQVQAGRATLAPNNVGSGSVYTIMERYASGTRFYGTLS